MSGLYTAGRLSVAKERFYGNGWNYEDPGNGHFYRDSTGSAIRCGCVLRTDEEHRCLGSADNLFDKRPHKVDAQALEIAGEVGSPAVEIYPKFTAWGINDGYYYARLRLNFR